MNELEALKRHTSQVPQGPGKPPKHSCTFCSSVFSGFSRIITHFAGVKGKAGAEAKACQKVLDEVRAKAQKHLGVAPQQKRPADGNDDADNDVQEVQPSKQSRLSCCSSTSRASMQAPITDYAVKLKHGEAQDAVCSFLFECGIPFIVLRHPAWHEMWDARKAGPGFQPLSYNTVRTTALKKVCSNAHLNSNLMCLFCCIVCHVAVCAGMQHLC